MVRKLFLVTVLVNCFIFAFGNESNNSSTQTNCPEAVERFNKALLRTTTKSLQVYSDSTNETGTLSPMASYFLLATFAMFARDETLEEIYRELDLRSTEEVMCVFTQFNDEVLGCGSFLASPSIFANNCNPLTSAFISSVDEIAIDGVAKNFDFSQSQQTGDAINAIIAQQTSNNIPMAVNDYSIFNSSSQLIPVSGVHLEGDWEIGFQQTNLTQFRVSPSESQSQTFMYQDAVYNYTHSDSLGAQVIQVNKACESLEVWALLPDTPFTEDALIAKMAENSDWYYDVKKSMKPTRVDLYVPFYKKSTTVNSANVLRKVTELKTTFDDQTINLKGAIEGNVKAAVSTGIQTTSITSTFEGGPVPDGLPEGPKKTFKADYPFVFLICRYDKIYIAGIFRTPVS